MLMCTLHQRVELEIELTKKRLVGYTELTIQPLSRLTTLALHCRQVVVTRVLVNNFEVHWTLKNYAECVVSEKLGECDADTFSTCLKAALDASDDGELLVQLSANEQENNSREGGGSGNIDNDHESGNNTIPSLPQPSALESVQPPLIVRIDFELVDPRGGVYFVLPDPEAYPLRAPHMYTCSVASGARVWLPCVDLPTEQCTWEMTYTAEKSLTVISSGTLLTQTLTPDETRKVWKFSSQNERWTASDLILCVGHFEGYRDPHLPTVTHYCLPHRGYALQHSVSFFSQAWRFFETYLNARVPFASFKQVFVEDAYIPVHVGAGCVVYSTHLLHDSRVIDQTFTTRLALARGLAGQWFGVLLHVRSLPDTWLLEGLAGYLTHLFAQKMFGNNEFRWHILRGCEYVCLHPRNQPLYQTNALFPFEFTTRLLRTKATLIMYLIERRLGTEGFQKLLAALVQTALVATTNVSSTQPPTTTLSPSEQQLSVSSTLTASITSPISTLSDNSSFLLSTKRFLKIAKKVTGQDLRPFAERWIYSRGCPHFVCGFWFNRAKHQTEFAIKQDLTFSEKMSGTLTIHIHEVDDIVDEHQVNIEDDVHLFEFPTHAKSRKVRRTGTAGSAPPPPNKTLQLPSNRSNIPNTTMTTTTTTTTTSSSSSISILSNGRTTLESNEDVEAETLSQKKPEVPILWLRVDPDLHWLRIVTLRMPSAMWLNQLEHDRDILAQYEAIQGLLSFPSSTTLSALNSVLNNRDVFYRIRIHAAHAMAKLTNKETNWLGLDLLFRFFKTHYYSTQTQQPKSNDFANFSSYFLQCAVPEAISLVRDESGRTPSDVIEFILTLLRNNDNSRNSYSDNYYVATLLRALGNVQSEDSTHERIQRQIERHLDLEKMMPCYHNVITCACLQTLTSMALQSQRSGNPSSDIDTLLSRLIFYSKYGNYQDVRVTALDCMMRLILDGSQPSGGVTSSHLTTLTQRILDILFNDKSAWVKHKLIAKWLRAPSEDRRRNRFAVFQPDTPHNIALRRRLWELLNSELTAYDWRLRFDVLQLYEKVGGGRTSQFKLNPRPKLATRPPTTHSSRSTTPSFIQFKSDELSAKKSGKTKTSSPTPTTPNLTTTNSTSASKKRKRSETESEKVASNTTKPLNVIKFTLPKREEVGTSGSLPTATTTSFSPSSTAVPTSTSISTTPISTKSKIKIKVPTPSTGTIDSSSNDDTTQEPSNSNAPFSSNSGDALSPTSPTSPTTLLSTTSPSSQSTIRFVNNKLLISIPKLKDSMSSSMSTSTPTPISTSIPVSTSTTTTTPTTGPEAQIKAPKRLTLRFPTSISSSTQTHVDEQPAQSQQETVALSSLTPSNTTELTPSTNVLRLHADSTASSTTTTSIVSERGTSSHSSPLHSPPSNFNER